MFQAAGSTADSIQSTVDAFRAALDNINTNNNNKPGPLASGLVSAAAKLAVLTGSDISGGRGAVNRELGKMPSRRRNTKIVATARVSKMMAPNIAKSVSRSKVDLFCFVKATKRIKIIDQAVRTEIASTGVRHAA